MKSLRRGPRHLRDRHHEKFVHRRLALMFTDVVDSTAHIVDIGDERWLALLAWHNDLLRASFAAHQGREVNALGDGFLVVFADPRRALQCALHIQEQLAGTRSDRGREIRVRIGIQWADVLETGENYIGRGLHEAARISELAAGDEVLVSVALLDAAGETCPREHAHAVQLRGLPAQYELVSVCTAHNRPYSTFARSLARM